MTRPCLLLFAPLAEGDSWRAVHVGLDGAVDAGSKLDAIPVPADNATETVLVVPVECTLRTSLVVPARTRRQAEQAAPYVLEEYLAEDVDALHLAFGERSAGGGLALAALAPELLRVWLQQLGEYGHEPQKAVVDADLLPCDEADIELLVAARRVWARAEQGDAVAGDRTLLEPLLSGLVRAREPGQRIRLNVLAEDDGLDLAQLESLLADAEPRMFERQKVDQPPAVWLAGHWPARRAQTINLLQGEFAYRRPAPVGRSQWRWVAGLALVWLGVQLASDGARVVWLEDRAAELRAESVALFRSQAPDRQRIPDPRRELEMLLRERSGGEHGVLPLIAQLGDAVAALEDDSVRLSSLNFSADRGDLALDLTAAGIEIVERLRSQIEQQGLSSSLESATQQAGRIQARLRIGVQS